MEDNYYVYGYYQNEIPFYIGCGKRERVYKHLKDCYKKDRKNLYFYNKLRKILENNEEFDIKILKNNLSYKDSRTIEQILIEFCGRKNINTGTLYNLTDGGEGFKGYKMTKENREKLSKRMKLQNKTPKAIELFKNNVSLIRKRKIIQYSKNGDFIKIFNSITETKDILNVVNSTLIPALKNQNKTAGGFRWVYYKEDYKENLPSIVKTKRPEKPSQMIKAIFKNGEEKIYNSAKEAAIELNTSPHNIRAVCTNSENRKQHKGIIFNYICSSLL